MLPGTGGHVTPLSTSVLALGKKSNKSRKEKQSKPSKRENRGVKIAPLREIRTIRQALWGTFPMGSRGTLRVEEEVNPGLRETVAAVLASRDLVHRAATPDVLRAYPFDLLLLAHRLPDSTGTNVLRRIIRACPDWILDLRGRSNLPSRHASVGPGDSQGEGSCIRTTIPTLTQEEREKS